MGTGGLGMGLDSKVVREKKNGLLTLTVHVLTVYLHVAAKLCP